MAAGPIALIGWLAVLSLLIIVVAGAFLALTGIAPEGGAPLIFVEAFWESLMRTLDSGTMGGDAGWGFRLRHAGRHARRHLRRLGADRRAQRRHRQQARRIAQGPLARAREATTRSSSTGRPRSSTSSPNWSSPMPAASGRASSSWPTRTRSRWRTRSPPRCRRCATRGSSAAAAIRPTSTIWRSSIRRPRARSSSCRRTATIRIRRSSRSVLALVNDPAPARRAIPHRRRDPRRQERRGRPRRRRRRGAAGAGRRPDLAHRRAFEPPGRA